MKNVSMWLGIESRSPSLHTVIPST